MGGVHIDGVPLHARDHLPDGPDPIDFPTSGGGHVPQVLQGVSASTTLGTSFTALDYSFSSLGSTAMIGDANDDVSIEEPGVFSYHYQFDHFDVTIDPAADVELRARILLPSNAGGNWSGFVNGTVRDTGSYLLNHTHQGEVANNTAQPGPLVIQGWVVVFSGASFPIAVRCEAFYLEDGSGVSHDTVSRTFWVWHGDTGI